MRILIFGAAGMFGHKLYQRLAPNFEVFGTIRSTAERLRRYGIFDEDSLIDNVDIADTSAVRRTVESVRPDCVINAVGIIKQVPSSKDVIQNLTVNSIFPHRLSELSNIHGFRLITISTDCVFDGKRGNYSEDDIPDARDLYGLSKLLGEVTEGNALTLRTSLIGRELATSHSLVEWFLHHRGRAVKGYTRAIYSGFPTIVVAGIVQNLIKEHPELRGLYHLSSEPISKFDLLTLLNEYYQAEVEIEADSVYEIDRSLDSSAFCADAAFEPPSWEQMIREMTADPTPYSSWHTECA
jgi:dTDP-4-dehydrorhamnose reductase